MFSNYQMNGTPVTNADKSRTLPPSQLTDIYQDYVGSNQYFGVGKLSFALEIQSYNNVPLIFNNQRNNIRLNGTAANSGVQFNSSVGVNRTTVGDVAYSVASSDHILAYTSLTDARTVTLPTAASIAGREYIIKDETGSAATNNITITTTSTQAFDGASTKASNTNYGAVRVYSNGSNWFTY